MGSSTRAMLYWNGTSRRISSKAELLTALKDLETDCATKPEVARLAVAADWDVISWGVGRDLSVLTTSTGSGDPPYFISRGKPGLRKPIGFDLGGEYTEYPGKAAVPYSLARAAVIEFFETRQRPTCIEWEET